MTDQYFQYIASGTHERLTRDEAIAVVRRTHGVVISAHPGGATLIAVEIRQLAGLTFRPVVRIDGWGWQEPVIAERYGKALVEAAAIATEAQNSGENKA